MTRNELEHIIRAAGAIAQVKELIILGSQSILGQFPSVSDRLPTTGLSQASFDDYREVLVRSVEADIMVPESVEKTEVIEGTIGELSAFHTTFGYYAQGVDETTCTLPDGWKTRLIPVNNENTQGICGLCLDIHDLMISKLYAGREKDIAFFHAAVYLGLISKTTLVERLQMTPMSDEHRHVVEAQIERGDTP